MPPPLCTYSVLLRITAVRMAMAKSISLLKPHTPTAPPYTPRLAGSSSSMISSARTFGAPDKVPAGKVAARMSILLVFGCKVPSTLETMCITCEYFSITIFSVTCTWPVWLMRPTSLRPKSISITCSAISLASLSKSSAIAWSCSGVAPRRRVPAIGRTTIFSPSRRTRISGEEPTTKKSSKW